MQELLILRERITALIKRYKALQQSHASLEKTCAKKDTEIDTLRKALASSDTNLLASEAGHSLGDPKEKARVRKQLDKVIGEIDKILTTLND